MKKKITKSKICWTIKWFCSNISCSSFLVIPFQHIELISFTFAVVSTFMKTCWTCEETLKCVRRCMTALCVKSVAIAPTWSIRWNYEGRNNYQDAEKISWNLHASSFTQTDGFIFFSSYFYLWLRYVAFSVFYYFFSFRNMVHVEEEEFLL